MGAMEIFENHVNENPKDPAGYHGWAEAAMFEIQENEILMKREMIESMKEKSNPI